MKILLVNTALGGGGGIASYGKQLIACLSTDSEMTVILGKGKKAPIENPNVKALYYDVEKLTIKNARLFINLINNEIKPDVVIASKATIIPVIAPYIDNHIKVITVSHSGRYFESDYCTVNHLYIDNIIAASSEYNKKYLQRKFHIKDNNKIKIIYNFLANDDEIEELRFKKVEQRPVSIVYAGGTAVSKSPALVSKIVRSLLNTNLNFRFYWTGGEPTIPLTTNIFKFSKLKNVKQILPNDERLIFPGRIEDKRDFDRLMGSANIQLSPSANEGCSMALLEGHRAGSIFIVADYENSNREIVEKGNSGFVIDHKDVGAFVQRISEIVNNPSAFNEYYENSHNTFIRYFSYPTWKKQLFEVINAPANHVKRERSVSNIGLWRGIIKMKCLWKLSLINRFFELSLPSYISFYKQYKTKDSLK